MQDSGSLVMISDYDLRPASSMARSPDSKQRHRRPEWTGSRRALVCLRYGIGDLIMQLPVLEVLRQALPEARITGVGAFPAIQVLEGVAWVDEVVDVGGWGFQHRWDEGTQQSRDRLTAWIAESGFDLLLDPKHAAPGVAQSIWAQEIPTYDADPAAEAEALRAGASGHDAIRAAVLAGWGLLVPDRPPRLRMTHAERRYAEHFLASRGLSGHTPIAVSAVASHPLKRWPVRKLARVTAKLMEVHGCETLLFRGPGTARADELESRPNVHSIPVLHLRRTAALLGRCAVLICNDTGLMHLAAAVGTPTVTTFGPTAGRLFRPPVAHAIAVQSGVPCPHRPTTALGPPGCWSSDQCLIAERSCIEQIEVATVTRAVNRLLRAGAATSPAG